MKPMTSGPKAKRLGESWLIEFGILAQTFDVQIFGVIYHILSLYMTTLKLGW